MMPVRRLLLSAAAILSLAAGAAAIATTVSVAPAMAQDWKGQYPELVYAIIPAENSGTVIDRWTPFVNYLSKELGTKVTLRIANDYAAVIEGQRSGNIHIAQYGPASYARARMTGAKIEPFAIEVNPDGSRGYHSVLWTKANSLYQKIADLKGKNLCLVDPNSTSGNNVPRLSLDKLGIDPDKFFGKVVYAGSHENVIFAINQGTCDAGFNLWVNDKESTLRRMADKGIVKAEDFRIIFTSDLIVNSPIAYLNDLPEDLRKGISTAIIAMPEKAPNVLKAIFDGKGGSYQPVDHTAYEPIVELNRFVDTLRKKRS